MAGLEDSSSNDSLLEICAIGSSPHTQRGPKVVYNSFYRQRLLLKLNICWIYCLSFHLIRFIFLFFILIINGSNYETYSVSFFWFFIAHVPYFHNPFHNQWRPSSWSHPAPDSPPSATVPSRPPAWPPSTGPLYRHSLATPSHSAPSPAGWCAAQTTTPWSPFGYYDGIIWPPFPHRLNSLVLDPFLLLFTSHKDRNKVVCPVGQPGMDFRYKNIQEHQSQINRASLRFSSRYAHTHSIIVKSIFFEQLEKRSKERVKRGSVIQYGNGNFLKNEKKDPLQTVRSIAPSVTSRKHACMPFSLAHILSVLFSAFPMEAISLWSGKMGWNLQ